MRMDESLPLADVRADPTDYSSSLIETGRVANCFFSHALMSSYCLVVVIQAPTSALEQYR